MKKHVITGILALFFLASNGEAALKDIFSKGIRPAGASYTDFIAGYIEYRAGNLDAALELYRKALKAAPNNPDILYEIASVQVKKGQVSDAKETLRKVLA